MIPVPSGVRVWLAVGRTDMRRGMNGLSLQVQETLGRDPFAGDLFVFRGRRGDMIKILWHDGLGLSLYAKRLERGRFVWPTTEGGSVAITAAQLAQFPSVTTRIVDRRPTALEVGQADGIQARSVETFQAFGFASEVIDEAYRNVDASLFARALTEGGAA